MLSIHFIFLESFSLVVSESSFAVNHYMCLFVASNTYSLVYFMLFCSFVIICFIYSFIYYSIINRLLSQTQNILLFFSLFLHSLPLSILHYSANHTDKSFALYIYYTQYIHSHQPLKKP